MEHLRVMRAEHLAQILGVSKGTIWRMSAAGQLPRPIKLTPVQTVWDAAEIDQWLADKKADRNAPVAKSVLTRGPNPVTTTKRPDAKRPGRPRKGAAA